MIIFTNYFIYMTEHKEKKNIKIKKGNTAC